MSGSPYRSVVRRVTDLPEFNVALFGFLLNYPWEFLQVPLFKGMATAPHWSAVRFCTRATLGDALIAVFAYWVVSAVIRRRRWITDPRWPQVAAFVGVGLLVTLLFERLATGPLDRWQYADAMPIIPLLGIGLAPLLQWLVLPPLLLWFVRRQIT